jgi:hypothetical protein
MNVMRLQRHVMSLEKNALKCNVQKSRSMIKDPVSVKSLQDGVELLGPECLLIVGLAP